jgi:hypothetical protein
MKTWHIITGFVLVAAVLTACGGTQATPTSETVSTGYTSDVLDTNYEGALDAGGQLALGTLQLEETEHAVTPEQAKTLIPLWQALQGGGVTVQAEMEAVLKQIEGTMTTEQLEAISAMQLTQEDVRTWMQEQGMQWGAGGGQGPSGEGQDVSPELQATRQAQFGSGEMPPDMATRRAEMENMSDEERQALRETAQAGGDMPGRAGAGAPGGAMGGAGQLRFLLSPLVELLNQRAAE